MATPLTVYVDVDDTLIRTAGTRRIVIPDAVTHVKQLKADGAILCCWSSGGAAYAREIAVELGITDLFKAFLPKPDVMLDDQHPREWRKLICVHPVECQKHSVDQYRAIRGY
jgi:hypothetical protein